MHKTIWEKNSANGHYLETITILKNIYIYVSSYEIEIDFSRFHPLVIKKGYFEEYVNNYLNGVYCLKKWTDLKIEKYGNKFRISI